ncbi:Endoplasmic reticulum-Golgi intermediate compartment protein 3-like [Homarus americanus]|uniref:Endoplasmic reticulum-Golgi intermediate compartment protein 3 n=1 Tax=Homarus americanus TaxID=6706 RepID=A0A8J5JMS5_HOMAM|nr:Endoplasmic reticulum-Golgi intermediate compartment protein 3-like [Homarus americanus]
MGSTVKSVADKLRQLDAYPKTQEDFQIKTLSGAAVAIVAGIIMALLFLSELYDYLTPKLAEDLFVDTTRGSKLRINLDVIFPNIPCNMLSLDAMDLSGEQHVNIHHNIYKRKLDLDGRPIQDPERQERIGHAVKEDVNGTQENNVVQTTAAPKCGSCYGAESEKDQCCNTCEDVKDAYRTKGWALPPLKNINQCVKEGKLVESSELPDEGCQIYGYLEVNRDDEACGGGDGKGGRCAIFDGLDDTSCYFFLGEGTIARIVGIHLQPLAHILLGNSSVITVMEKSVGLFHFKVGGNFHLAPGKSFQHNHLHIHDVQQYRTADFDLSHRIRHLSFGVNIPGKTNPIDGTELKTEKGPKTINYYIKIVPTTYEKVDGSLGHFLTGVCSIIGGVFTVAGIIDSIIYHSHRALQRKIEIGKAT